MRILIVTVAALWGIASVLVFLRAKEKSADASLTAAYILLYPVLVVVLFLNEPVPPVDRRARYVRSGALDPGRPPPLEDRPGSLRGPARRDHGHPKGVLVLGRDRRHPARAAVQGMSLLRMPSDASTT